MSFDKYSTLSELLEERKRILARPFPQGYSGDERRMMDRLEAHCTDHFDELVEALDKALAFMEFPDAVPSSREELRNEIEALLNVAEKVKE